MRKNSLWLALILIISISYIHPIQAQQGLQWEDAVPVTLGTNYGTTPGFQDSYWMYFDGNRSLGYSFSLIGEANSYLNLYLYWYNGEDITFLAQSNNYNYPQYIESNGYDRYYIYIQSYGNSAQFQLDVKIADLQPAAGSRANPIPFDMGENTIPYPDCCDAIYYEIANTTYPYLNIQSQITGASGYFDLDITTYDNQRLKRDSFSATSSGYFPHDLLVDTAGGPFLIELRSSSTPVGAQLHFTISNTTAPPGSFRSNAVLLATNSSINIDLPPDAKWFGNISTVSDTWYYLSLHPTVDYYLAGSYKLLNGSNFQFYNDYLYDESLGIYFKGDGSNFTFSYDNYYNGQNISLSLIEKLPPPGATMFNRIALSIGEGLYSVNGSSTMYFEFSGVTSQYYEVSLDILNSTYQHNINLQLVSPTGQIIAETPGDSQYPRSLYINGQEKYLIRLVNDHTQGFNVSITSSDFDPPVGFDVPHAQILALGKQSFAPFDIYHDYVFNMSTSSQQLYWLEIRGLDNIDWYNIDVYTGKVYEEPYWMTQFDEYANKISGWILGSGEDLIIRLHDLQNNNQAYSISLNKIDYEQYQYVRFFYQESLEQKMHFNYVVGRKLNGATSYSGSSSFSDGTNIDVEIQNTGSSSSSNLLYGDNPWLQIYSVGVPYGSFNQRFSRYFLLPSSIYAGTGPSQTLTGDAMYALLFPGFVASSSDTSITLENSYTSPLIEYTESFEYNSEYGNLDHYSHRIVDKLSGNTEEITVDLTSITHPDTPIETQPKDNQSSPIFTVPIMISPWIIGFFVTAAIVQKKKRAFQH